MGKQDEIEKALVNATGETIEIHYNDGLILEGFVSRVNPNYLPAYVVLTPHEGKEDHRVNIPNVKKIVIKHYGKEHTVIG